MTYKKEDFEDLWKDFQRRAEIIDREANKPSWPIKRMGKKHYVIVIAISIVVWALWVVTQLMYLAGA